MMMSPDGDTTECMGMKFYGIWGKSIEKLDLRIHPIASVRAALDNIYELAGNLN